MGTWGNLGKVNCGHPDVIPALCPGLAGSYPPQAQRANGTEMSAAATRSHCVCTHFTLLYRPCRWRANKLYLQVPPPGDFSLQFFIQCQIGTIDSLPQLIHNTEKALTKRKHYFNRSGFLLNSMKTQCIFIESWALIFKIPGNRPSSAGEASILPSRSVKNLGLHLDNYMSFDVHVTKMSKKVSGTLIYINLIQDLHSREARLIAIETIALNHINYGIFI